MATTQLATQGFLVLSRLVPLGTTTLPLLHLAPNLGQTQSFQHCRISKRKESLIGLKMNSSILKDGL